VGIDRYWDLQEHGLKSDQRSNESSHPRMKKQLIIFHGKFLECESLLELYSTSSPEDWFTICDETTKSYCYLRVAKDLGPAKMSKQDARIFKRLGDSIEMMKLVDPEKMGELNLDELSKAHVALIQQEWALTQKDIQIAHNAKLPNADIIVSDI
jgi:hypothetical protein